MAIARLCMRVGKVGKAAPHAAYIARQGKYANRVEKGERLIATEAGNMPAWAANPLHFWDAADKHERKNGTTYREMEIALPREMSDAQQVELVRQWVRQEIGDLHAFQWAIHCPKAVDGGDQPHLHLMFSERQIDGLDRDPDLYFKRFNAKDPERGGARKGYGPRAGESLKKAERVAELKELRARWESLCNAHLEVAGSDERIDMRSHAERGTGLDPERKMLPSEWRGDGKSNVVEFRRVRAELSDARQNLARVIPDLDAEIISLEAARQRREEAMGVQEEVRRIEMMSSQELADEIARLRPLPMKDLARNLPEVIRAQEDLKVLIKLYRKAAKQESQANLEVVNWRKDNPVKTGFHDLKISPSLDLRRLAKKQDQARQEQLALLRRIDDAKAKVIAERKSALDRVRAEQAPIIAKLRALEMAHDTKVLEEKAAKLHGRKASQVFVRLARQRCLGDGDCKDGAAYWEALPEKLRNFVDEFNLLAVEHQGIVLSRIREDQGISDLISESIGLDDPGQNDLNFSR